MNKIKIFNSIVLIISAFTACNDKSIDPGKAPVNETELITTLKVILTDSADGSKSVYTFRDIDGEGGNPPDAIDTIKLKAQWRYDCSLLYLDESKTPADTVSNEIESEADNHLIQFNPGGINMNISRKDKDGKGLELGLKSDWKTFQTGKGNLQILLKHQPGIKNGDPGIGETDADINFPVQIK